jgi:hypothetical protein
MSKSRRLGQVAKEEVDGVGGRHPPAAGLNYRDGGMLKGAGVAGACAVRSVQEAAVSISAVLCKSEGLVQPKEVPLT